MSFISYAQNFEDVMLRRALKDVVAGFYVDVGANDPVVDSVTKGFYDHGWHGINIEPLQPHWADLNRDRPLDVNLLCAAGESTGEVDLWETDVRGWATASTETVARHQRDGHQGVFRKVAMRTLSEILATHAPGTIHFLKIDVEGFEGAVIRGMDFSRFRPWIVVAEAAQPNSLVESFAEWEPGLIEAGYAFAYSDGLNRFYVACEQSPRLDSFRYPPNVFDDFVRYREIDIETRMKHAEERVMQLDAQLQLSTAHATQSEALARKAESGVEQAMRRAELSEVQAQQSEARAQQSEARAQLSEARAERLEARTREVDAQLQLSAAHATQSEALARKAESSAEQAMCRAELSEVRAQQSEARAQQSEARAQLSEARAERLEARAREVDAQLQLSAAHATQSEALARKAESSAEQAMCRAELSEVRAQQSEARAERLEARAREVDLQLQHAAWEGGVLRDQIATLQAHIGALRNSTSWQVTRPLRGIKRVLSGDVLPLQSAGATTTLKLKQTLRPALAQAIRAVFERPALRASLSKALKKLPWLHRRLLRVAANTGAVPGLADVQAPAPASASPGEAVSEQRPELSPRARRVLLSLTTALTEGR